MRSLDPLEAPVDPVAALRRVAFLLERSRQHSRRVEAFRGAVATLRELDEGEVRERVEAGVAHARVARELGVSRTTLYAALSGSGAYATT